MEFGKIFRGKLWALVISIILYRVLMSAGKFRNFSLIFRTENVLENEFGFGMSWKLKLKVFETPGK